MGWAFLLLIVAVIVAVIIAMKAKRQSGKSDALWPFYAKKPLTQPEQILYFRLRNALPDHIILAQVQLSRFLGVKKGNNFHAWNNRINRMSADFVVCNKDSSIVAVIELDDESHEREIRKTADLKKNKALSDAGISIVRWQVKMLPDEPKIKASILPNSALKGDVPKAAGLLA